MDAGDAIADLGVAELVRAFARRDISPVEAAESALSRIHRFNGLVNAYCFLDEKTTIAASRESEKRYDRGEPLGAVDGVPIAIKDVFMTKGWPNRKGSRVTDSRPCGVDAPAVAALRRHGFVPLGKTTTPEFGWKGVTDSPLTGITTNPWDIEKTSGGSSGGSAAALPLGMGVAALGTDAGGSIRIPAGFCGIFGFKPTHGRLPMWPGSPFGTLAHAGPMTRSVLDAAVLMNVLSERDARDTTLPPLSLDFVEELRKDVEGLRIAFSLDFGYVRLDPEVAESVASGADRFEQLGAQVHRLDPGFPEPRTAFERLFNAGAANALRHLDGKSRELVDPGLLQIAEEAGRLSAMEYLSAVNQRDTLWGTMNRFHERFDLLITPTLPLPAFSAGRNVPEDWDDERWPSWTPFTYPFNLTGQPACSVPGGFTMAGLPIGLQIIGARHRDDLVLRAAYALEQSLSLTRRPAALGTA